MLACVTYAHHACQHKVSVTNKMHTNHVGAIANINVTTVTIFTGIRTVLYTTKTTMKTENYISYFVVKGIMLNRKCGYTSWTQIIILGNGIIQTQDTIKCTTTINGYNEHNNYLHNILFFNQLHTNLTQKVTTYKPDT